VRVVTGGDLLAANRSQPVVRAEPRPCVVCQREIQAGQLYVVGEPGPCHVFCRPPSRLDVQRVEQAARQR